MNRSTTRPTATSRPTGSWRASSPPSADSRASRSPRGWTTATRHFYFLPSGLWDLDGAGKQGHQEPFCTW